MDINYRSSFKIFGAIMLVMSLAMMLPLIVAVIYSESDCIIAFAQVIVPSAIIGLMLMKLIKSKKKALKMRDGAFIVSITWILFSLIGSIPFMLTDSIPNFADAFFETASGFTTTGSTVVSDIEGLPKAILFWRSLTHWLGGMGILIFTIALLPALGIDGQQVASAEMPGPTLSKITPKLSDTARYLYILYVLMTLAETILLMFGGMSLFDALCHSFSSLGTGGFSNYNNSIMHFQSGYIEVILALFMFLAGMNFNLFFIFFRNGISAFIKDGEWKLYVGIVACCTLIVAIPLYVTGIYGPGDALRHSFFQNVTVITTTGFASADYMLWPVFCQSILFLLFFVGGSTSSTSGGIKVLRILVFAKMVKRSLVLRLHPNAVVPIKVNDRQVSGDTVSHMSGFLFLYIGVGVLCTFIISFDGFDAMTNISAAFSCLGNIGLGFNEVGPSGNFGIFSDFSKIVMAFTMIAGRLELFTLLVLFTKRFWRPFR